MSVVGTSTINNATYYTHHRKLFYFNSLYWVFYTDGTNMVYCTSVDGVSWSSPTIVRACNVPNRFAICFDGTYIHYEYSNVTIYYRRGTPNNDGTITWSAAEQNIAISINPNAQISVDSSGYPWIGYIKPSDTTPYVIKSSTNDGTWSTASGFPYQLTATSSNGWYINIIALTLSKMFVIYSRASELVYAQSYDGSAWNPKVSTTKLAIIGLNSAIAQGDDVHICFENRIEFLNYNTEYVKYTYLTNSFGTEITLQTFTPSGVQPVISMDSSSYDLYCFWCGYPTTGHIYYKKYTAATDIWDTDSTDWITVSLSRNDILEVFSTSSNYLIGIEYTTGSVSPYNVNFSLLIIPKISEYSIDTILRKVGQHKYDIDVVLTKNNIPISFTIDVILKSSSSIICGGGTNVLEENRKFEENYWNDEKQQISLSRQNQLKRKYEGEMKLNPLPKPITIILETEQSPHMREMIKDKELEEQEQKKAIEESKKRIVETRRKRFESELR